MAEPRTKSRRAADETDFVHTGPGTLAGRYLRTFWQPVFRADDLTAGRAVPLRIMSEEFVLYRGENGAAHLLAPRCAHRGTLLSAGWVEGDCIRCFYHGWKYDASGQCVEQPAEEPSFAGKVRIRNYPVREYLGFIFAYLGEGDPPPLPRYPEFEDEGVLDAQIDAKPYNYFQRLENSVDPVHVAFVHRESQFTDRGLRDLPKISAEETEYGMAVRATRPNGSTRATHFLMPTMIYLKQPPKESAGDAWREFLSWRVPVDDQNHLGFLAALVRVTGDAARRVRETRPNYLDGFARVNELGEAVLAGKLRIEDIGDRANIINVQDYIAQRGQGAVVDRAHERLGRSDAAVILLRKIWARELRALAKGKPLQQWRRADRLVTTTGV